MTVATTVAVLIAAVCATAMPIVVVATSQRWWTQIFGRYIMWQCIAFALILDYAGYSRLALLFGWPRIPSAQVVLLVIFVLIASVKALGVYTFLRGYYLKRLVHRVSAVE